MHLLHQLLSPTKMDANSIQLPILLCITKCFFQSMSCLLANQLAYAFYILSKIYIFYRQFLVWLSDTRLSRFFIALLILESCIYIPPEDSLAHSCSHSQLPFLFLFESWQNLGFCYLVGKYTKIQKNMKERFRTHILRREICCQLICHLYFTLGY